MTIPTVRYNAERIVHFLKNLDRSDWLLIIGLVAGLLQIWLPAYYLNCDGPCHVANARAMLEMCTHPHEDFYTRFYTLSKDPNPNWLSNILLAALLPFVKGAIAEKILLSGYVMLMVISFRRLLQRFCTHHSVFVLLFLVFVFNNTLAQGFYNFSFSIAFCLLLVNSWLAYLEQNKLLSVCWVFVYMMLTYFSHPVSFGYGVLMCYCLLLSYLASGLFVGNIKRLLTKIVVITICTIPFVLFFLTFADKSARHGKIILAFMPERVYELVSFDYLINYSSSEVFIVKVLGGIFSLLFLSVLVFRFFLKKGFHKYDGLILALLIVFYAFLNMPDKMMGGGFFVMRTGIYLFIITGLCAAYLLPNTIKNTIGYVGFAVFLLLVFVRLPTMITGANMVQEHVAVADLIPERSVLLPLNFNKFGKKNEGELIADKNEVYGHVAQYIGADKKILVLDNYEANTGYFPLDWKSEVNPYIHLNRYRGIEGIPPGAGPVQYRQITGVNIDYVLLLNYEPSINGHGDFIELKTQLDTAYHETYRSVSGKTILLATNPQ